MGLQYRAQPTDRVAWATDLSALAKQWESNLQAPIQRLQRAYARLARITEACLWLLGDPAKAVAELCAVQEQLRLVTDELQDEVKQRGKVINLTCDASPQWRCPAEVLQLITISLIRNAMQHGCGPDIDILLQPASLTISYRIEAKDGKGGFGLGLPLLQRLCDRFNFNIVYKPGFTRSAAAPKGNARMDVFIFATNSKPA